MMLRLRLWPVFLLLSWCLSYTVRAQQAYEPRTFTTRSGNALPYRILYPPNYDRSQKYPLVLFLHGAGERGNDNEKQLTHGSKLFLEEKNRTSFPAIVVFPQCPEDSYWSTVKIDRTKQPLDLRFDYDQKPTWPLQGAIDLVKKLSKEEGVDKNRIYIVGLSMGGMGTFEALSRYPKLFAAAIPICGGGNAAGADRYAKRVPVWIFHGSEDAVVDPKYSREMYAQLQARNARVQYKEYPGVNHNSWDNAFAEPDLLSWLFAQNRKKK